MFDRIAPRYDLLNRILSLRRDVAWRKFLYAKLPAGTGLKVLDLATGTGDVLITLLSQGKKVAAGVGLDRSAGMLALGKRKLCRRDLSRSLSLVRGDACAIGGCAVHSHARTPRRGQPERDLAMRTRRR